MIVVWLVAAIMLGKIRGGRLSALANVRFEYTPLLLAAFALQLLGVLLIRPHSLVGGALAMLAGFALLMVVAWSNRKLPGIHLIMLGLGLNILVIAANGGSMPTTAAVVKAIGRSDQLSPTQTVATDKTSLMGVSQQSGPITATVANTKAAISPDPKLLFLGDVIVIPLPGRLASAVSIGDIILAIGLIPLCGWAMGVARPSSRGSGIVTRSQIRTKTKTSLFTVFSSIGVCKKIQK